MRGAVIGLVLVLFAQLTFSADNWPSSGSRPIAFTKNMGQWPDSILFRADAGGAVMWFVKDGIYYQYFKRIPRPRSGEEALAAAGTMRGRNCRRSRS